MMNPPAFCRNTQGSACFAPNCDCWGGAIQFLTQVNDNLRAHRAEIQALLDHCQSRLEAFEHLTFQLTGNEGDDDALTVLTRWAESVIERRAAPVEALKK